MVNGKFHYRWDFIGLSTDTKPTPTTSEKVVNGSTFYCSDDSKLYVWYKDQWYERTAPEGGGGGGTSNFNQLSNRPKYNSSTMTGDTNIPKVPTKTSELSNDSGFITSSSLPTVNDATLTITQNGVSAGTFTANDADDTTIALTDTTYTAFTGTDGRSAGTAGLVPAPATTDAGKFLKADGTWDTAGGGSGPTVTQNMGNSQTSVMSQNAVTAALFSDPANRTHMAIGGNATNVSINGGTAIGNQAYVSGAGAIAISGGWNGANASADGAIRIGSGMNTVSGRGAMSLGYFTPGNSTQGKIEVGSTEASYGYNNSNYRLISGIYDGQADHDAATVGQIKMGVLSTSPTGTTAGFPGRLYTLDTGGGSYDVYLCVHDNGDNTYVWKQLSLI